MAVFEATNAQFWKLISYLSQVSKKSANIGRKGYGLFVGSKMSSLRHGCPLLHIVYSFRPFSRWHAQLPWKNSDGSWNFDFLIFLKLPRIILCFIVKAGA